MAVTRSKGEPSQDAIPGDTVVTLAALDEVKNCRNGSYYWRTRHDSNV
jgi:hypothetical protein